MSSRGARVTFRSLAGVDLPSMSRWLADPEVARWWREEDTVRAKYSPLIDGSEPVRAFVIAIDGNDVGFIQGYRLRNHP